MNVIGVGSFAPGNDKMQMNTSTQIEENPWVAVEGEKSVTEEATRILEEFFRSFSGKAHPLLLLDYDGTLAPFRVDRSRARP